jgi:CoA:oxalate CoA-transferase
MDTSIEQTPDDETGLAETPRPAPLTGIRVVESSSYVSGPYSSTMLADLGAEVIKVEPPGGDGFRSFGHQVGGWSALWSSTNRGKRSIVLDLKDPDDLATMRQLLTQADVMVENWRPHVAASLGLGQDVVQPLNPQLVRLSISGFGESGPLAKAPAFDSLIQGHTGMIDLLSHNGRPDVAPYWVVDKVVAAFGAQAVLAALYQRERTGMGSHVCLPMLDVMAYFNFPDMFQHRTFVSDVTPWAPVISPLVRTADGYLVITPVSGAQLSRTLKALDRPDIKAEMLAMKNSVEMIDFFYKQLNAILSTKPSAHWLALFESFDLPVAPVKTLDEHLCDPQVLHNGIYSEIPSPVGLMRAVRYPAWFDHMHIAPAGRPPVTDEHAAQIRAELAVS